MKRVLTLMLALILCLSCFAACNDNEKKPDETETKAGEEETLTTEQALKNAVAYVKDMYKQFLKTPETPIDYKLVSAVKVGGVDYTVTWTVDNEAINVVPGEGEVTIDVPEKAEADIAYKLTATVTAADGTKSEPLVFELTVPAFKVNTIEEYYKAEKDALVVFEGIVTGIVSTTKGATNKCIFLQDKEGKGGCYVYGMTDDPIADLGIEIGMTVRAAGAKDIYNGTHELKPTGIEIISTEKTDVTPIDLTEAFTAAADLKAESLVGVQGALVTIKGVEITGQEESSGYYKFKLGELETYVRISGSTCAISKDDQATFKATHTEKRGFKADVTGIVSIYNGAFYLVPVTVDAFSNFQEITRTDAEKVEYEAANITAVPEEIKLDGATVDLPLKGATYQDVVITWTSDKAWATIDETGKLTVRLQAAEETLKLTATVSLGENTKTVEFTVKVAKKPTVVPQVVDTPAVGTAYKFFLTQQNNGEILYLNGQMSGYYFATTTNHEEAVDVYLETVEGGYKFYFMNDNSKTYISVVRVESNGSMFNNVVFNAETPSVWTWNEEYKTLTTVIDVDGTATTFYLGTYNNYNTISASKIDKAATSFVCHLATMVDIANCTHKYSGDCDTTCNICNAERTVTAEHTYTNACDAECDVCGATRTPADHVYDNACDKDCNVCGETRTTQHVDENGDKKCDVCNENICTHVDANSDCKCDNCEEIMMPAADSIISLPAATVIGNAQANDTYTSDKFYVIGVIKSIDNTTFGNMTIKDEAGNEFYLYGLYKDGAKYGEMTEKPAVGDTIKVYSGLGNHGGTAQMKNAELVEFTAHSHAYPDSGLTAVCTVCGAIKDHTCVDTNADNKCDLCDKTLVIPTYTCKEANGLEKGVQATVSGTISAINGKNVIITDETGTFQIYNPTNLTDLGLGDKITITGTIGEYNSTKQISGATATIDEDHSEVGCSYPETGLTAVCTLCGAIKEHACVDTTPVDGTCDACGADMPVAGQTTLNWIVSEVAADNGWTTNGTKPSTYPDYTLDDTITMTLSATDSNTGKIYNSKEIRIYQTGTPTITFTAKEGYSIKSIAVTYSISNTGILTHNGENITSGTVVDVNDSSVAFGVGNTETATNGQVRISEIVIVYTQNS